MKCPKCASERSYVKDSRNVESTKRRRRKCRDCGHRWTTLETSVEQYNHILRIQSILGIVNKLTKESMEIMDI